MAVLANVAQPGARPTDCGAAVVLVAQFGASDNTSEITKAEFHWNMPLKVHWLIQVTIRRESDNPFGVSTEQ